MLDYSHKRKKKNVGIREVSQDIFFSELIEKNNQLFKNNLSVLIVGGDENEPEKKIIENVANASFHYLNIVLSNKKNHIFHDLNLEYTNKQFEKYFDVILCNQVFEHIYDINQALINLEFLLNKNGLIWLTFPASNFYHESPEFYSSGYSVDIITKLIENKGLEVLFEETLCNQRTYLYRHVLNIWPGEKEFFHPFTVLMYFKGTLLNRILQNFCTLPHRFLIAISSKKFNNDKRYQCESILILKHK